MQGRALIALRMSSPENFRTGLPAAAGRQDPGCDPRFGARMTRVESHDALIEALRSVFADRTRDEWSALLTANDAPFASTRTLTVAQEDEQAAAPPADERRAADPHSHRLCRRPPVPDEHGPAIRARLRGEAWALRQPARSLLEEQT